MVSKTIAQSKALSLTLFAFDKGEEIGTHSSDGDALVIVLDGQGQITIDDTLYSKCRRFDYHACSAPTQCICKRAVQNVSCGGISIVLNKPYKNKYFLLPETGNSV